MNAGSFFFKLNIKGEGNPFIHVIFRRPRTYTLQEFVLVHFEKHLL